MPATSQLPNDRWSLAKVLMRRESGFHPYESAAFSRNKERRTTNLFIPSKKEDRLISQESLYSRVYICKHNKDGSKLITATQDGYINIYDSSKTTYDLTLRIEGPYVRSGIFEIDFSPCGQYFAYSSYASEVFVVPMNGLIEQMERVHMPGIDVINGIFSLRFSPCGREIIGGGIDGHTYHCDRETRDVQRVLISPFYELPTMNAISYTSDTNSSTFVTGNNDGILKLWDKRNIDPRRSVPSAEFIGHLDAITYIDARNDGNYLLTNSKDQTIKMWDLRKPTDCSKVSKAMKHLPMRVWDYHRDKIPAEYDNPNISIDGDASVMTYHGHHVTKSLFCAKFSPAAQTGQRFIYAGCSTGRIIIYDVLTGTIKEAIEGHNDVVRDLSWHPDRSEIISGSFNFHVNFNSHKRPSSEPMQRPLRRSRRIAVQNSGFDDDETDEMYPPLAILVANYSQGA